MECLIQCFPPQECDDGEGHTFYFCLSSGESAWEKPRFRKQRLLGQLHDAGAASGERPSDCTVTHSPGAC